MTRRCVIAVVLLLGAGAIAGCYETPDVTIHEPGQYKGKRDPLLNQQASSRDEALHKRFDLVQTDR